MPVYQDDDISKAVSAARQPNLVTEDDVAGTWSPRSNPTQGQTVNSYSSATEAAPLGFGERLSNVLYNRFVQPAISAVTAPGRVYRGEVPEDQMIDEAKNMAGQVMLGSFGVGIPSALREGINPNVLRSGFGGAESLSAPARQLNDIGHYSHAAEQASTLQPRGDATQMISTLKNMPGVKPEELQNAGLIDAQGNVHPEWAERGKITREDLAGHLQSSMPQVQETVLKSGNTYPYRDPEEWTTAISRAERAGNFNEAERLNAAWEAQEGYGSAENTKYGQYTLPGGENYREVLLKLPMERNLPEGFKVVENPIKSPTSKKYIVADETGWRYGSGNTETEAIDNYSKNHSPNKFVSSHWKDDPNVLAHVRMADRAGPNGEKILHVEEIQSDWGQKGRDQGFAIPATKKMSGQVEPDGSGTYKIVWEDGSFSGGYSRESAEARAVEGKTNEQVGVPTAPYVTNTGSWTDLALKRALKEAAEGGYDKLVWTPGSEQAGRYSLSNHVDRIAYDPEEKTLSYVPKNNNGRGWTNHPGDVEPKDLAEIIGKDAAERLLAEKPNPLSGIHSLEAPDLSFGGEGMKEYYDKIVPNQLKKIAKHYDPTAKVGYTDVMLPPSGKAGTNNPPMAAPGLNITPQMREAIMRGQKAFKRGGRTLGNNAIDNALRLATGGRAHFDDGGDAGGDVRGGDNPGGYSGDTGRFSGNQDAANNFRMGDSPGGFGGDTGRYSSHDVGAEQGAINAQTARDQQNQQNERQAQESNPDGYSVRSGNVPGGLGGDTGRYSGGTNAQQAQQDAITATLQGNMQRARQQQQQAFDKYMNQIQGPESGGQGSAYNATTGAFGAYQLMPKTALGLMQKYAPGETYRPAEGTSNPADVAAGGLNAGPGYVGLTPQEQLRDITLNQDLQRTLAEGLTRDNMATLSSAGIPINSGSLYTAHLLGAGDALKVLQSDPNTPLSQTGINPQAISNNKLEGMTAGQLLDRSGRQMAATPASGVSSAGGYGRLAENVTDNSGARITDATASPDAAVTAAKAAATAQQPSIIDKIFGSTQDQIDKLAAKGQYSGMDKQQYADKFANGDPNAVKERIIYDNGQPKVDYYTKDLNQALFGDPLKALQTGISGLFKPSTSDNGFRSSVTQPTDNAAPTYGGHGGQQAINQAIAVAQPQQVAAPAPYIAQLGNYNSQLSSTTGQTAEQWAAANTGGDMSRVNGRIKYVNGAPMLEFYSA
jgi:hypothetical protein